MQSCGSSVCSLILLLGTQVLLHGNDDLDDVKRQLKIAAKKFEDEMRSEIVEAARLALKKPGEAVKWLEGVELRLEIDRLLTAERRKELKDEVAGRLKEYRKRAGIDPPRAPKPFPVPRPDPRLFDLKVARELERSLKCARDYDEMIDRGDQLRRALERLRSAPFQTGAVDSLPSLGTGGDRFPYSWGSLIKRKS